MAKKLTVKEIRKIIESEMGAVKDPKDVKIKQRPWWDADGALENEIDWYKALKIKELFAKRLNKG